MAARKKSARVEAREYWALLSREVQKVIEESMTGSMSMDSWDVADIAPGAGDLPRTVLAEVVVIAWLARVRARAADPEPLPSVKVALTRVLAARAAYDKAGVYVHGAFKGEGGAALRAASNAAAASARARLNAASAEYTVAVIAEAAAKAGRRAPKNPSVWNRKLRGAVSQNLFGRD